MADPFVAEIRIFPFNFPPKGWAFCNGQLLPISQNTALFSLLGTTYGGDGKSTFALPDMQDNAPMHPGQGQGLSLRDLGEMSGSEFVTLLVSEMPAHAHFVGRGNAAQGDTPLPQSAVWASSAAGRGTAALYADTANAKVNQLQSLFPTGSGLPHNNMQPYLALSFCIALQGVFPARP